MKKIFIISALCILLFSITAFAEYTPAIDGEPEFNENVVSLMTGENILSPKHIISMLYDGALSEIKESAGYIVMLMLTAAMSSAVGVMSDSFGKKSGSEAAFFACFAVMSMTALKCFDVTLEYGMSTIKIMNNFVTKLSPLLMTILIVCGKSASAAVFHPVLSSAVFTVSMLVEKVLIPMNVFAAVLAAAGNIGTENRISGFITIIKSINKWLMAAVVTIFTGISAIYGFNAPSLDALSVKMVKFAAGTLVPVVGGFLSDTLETVVGSSVLMKNAVGGAGIIALCSICMIPILKTGVIYFMLRLSAAFTELMSDKRISTMLWEMSDAAGGIFGMIVMSAVMFIINFCIILAATNFT